MVPAPEPPAAPPAPVPVPPAAPPPPAPAPAEPKTVPPTAVRYLSRPAPVYPAYSRRVGETGRVVVRVLIDERGSPAKAVVQQSSGHKRLDDSALTAVRAARFQPFTEDGSPRPVWVLIPIVFDLEN
jgi:protein TonB